MTTPIQLIAIDLDGTLLNSQHELTERTEKAIKAAMEKGVHIIFATGKTRGSALSLIARLGLTSPGIYLQGLATYNADASLRHQTLLDKNIARQVITFAEDRGFTVVAYSGTRILTRKNNRDTNILVQYGEPDIEAVGALQNILDTTPINKVMAVKKGEYRAISALRWQLDMQLDGAARLVQAALPDMLEIVPPGGSKGAALKTLLKDLGIPAENMLAIGDGENDIEMIQLAGIGVAMGNALPKIKSAADHVTATNDADGVVEAIERFVLKVDEPAPVIEKQDSAVENTN
jgi:Cof subfamily protein (haloacid dehalogenase superfamily)